MKLTITIETDGPEPRVSVENRSKWAPEEKAGLSARSQRQMEAIRVQEQPPSEAPRSAGPPLVPSPEPEARPGLKPGSGPRFDAEFLRAIRESAEPFTRQSISVASGRDVVAVTQSLNRMQKKGWVESPAHGLWRRTKLFVEQVET